MLLSTRIDFSSGLDSLASRRLKEVYLLRKSYPWIVWPGIARILNKTTQAAIERRGLRSPDTRSRDGSSGQKASGSSIYIFGQGDLKGDQGDSNRAPQEQLRSCEEFHSIAPPHLSLTQSSSTSTQVYREESNPPYRRVHKVRKAIHTESGYPLR